METFGVAMLPSSMGRLELLDKVSSSTRRVFTHTTNVQCPSAPPFSQVLISARVANGILLDELGNWRPVRNKFKDGGYFEAYHAHIDKTEPKEDYDDRNALYGL